MSYTIIELACGACVAALILGALLQLRAKRQLAEQLRGALERASGGRAVTSKRVLVVVNPVAGGGHGMDIFRNVVQPMLQAAGVNLEVVFLTGSSHAVELATEERDGFGELLGSTDCLLFVSGDGTLREYINRVYSLDPELHVLKGRALCIVPVGTSNCLALSLGYERPWQAVERALEFLRGQSVLRDLDLYSIEQESRPEVKTVDFCLTCWGILADIDLTIEGIRDVPAWCRALLHEMLKLLLPLKEIVLKRLRRVKIVIHPPQGKPVSLEDEFSTICVQNLARTDVSAILTPDAKLDDGLIHVLLWGRQSSRLETLAAFLAVDSGRHVGMTGISVHPARKFEMVRLEGGDIDVCGTPLCGLKPGEKIVLEALPSKLQVV